MANRISAFGYLECSAKTKEGVRRYLRWLLGLAFRSKNKRRGAAPFSEIPKTSPPSFRGLQKLPLPSVTSVYQDP